MPTPGNRKQRYVLDIDDVVKDGFMTKANAEALIRGINGSGGSVKLAVPYGGTNNGVFVDQELVKYDSATGKIMSAGFTGVIPGGYSVFIPLETGSFYSNSGVDTTTKSSTEFVIAAQDFDLPANSQWSDLMVTYQFALNELNPDVTGLEIRLGDDPIPPVGIIQPSKTLLYQVGAPPDNVSVTWIAMGKIPSSRAYDNPLQVNLFGAAQDITSYRTVLTRASFRGVVPEPAAGGQKGVPVFFTAPVSVYEGDGPLTWTSFNITPYVPEGVSAVILHTYAQSNEQGGGRRDVTYRADVSTSEYLLASCRTNNDEDDIDTDTTQMVLPYKSSSGVRSFQFMIEFELNTRSPQAGVTIELAGYVS